MGDEGAPFHFADRLMARVRHRGSALCVGLDPVHERLPAALRGAGAGDAERAKAVHRFSRDVLEAVAEHVGCVKIQAACFERYRAAGVEVLFQLIEEARALGLLVILDAKRGDVPTSSAHYAAGLLGDGNAGPDALTVHAYPGADGMEPFIQAAASAGKGLFALVRTSNPGADAIQSLRLRDGRTVAEAVGDEVAMLSASKPLYVGEGGYSLLGAVVGATKREELAGLRRRLARQILLVPGLGAQGATVEDVRPCFGPEGEGAILTASRSVLYAYEQTGDKRWQRAVAEAARDLKIRIHRALEKGS